MSNAITSFRYPYGWLSNFYAAPITYRGITYPTVEHAYQALRTTNETWQKRIRQAPTPGEAKRLGRQAPTRPDWNQIKFDVMGVLLRIKFTTHAHLYAQLIATGDAQLIEGNTWNTVWGCVLVDGQWLGQNKLGKLLMQVRCELMAESQAYDHAAKQRQTEQIPF